MSTLAIILVVVAALVALLVVGGVLGARRRDRAVAPCYAEHLAAADRALEQARASDRGWERELLHTVAHEALAASHPGLKFSGLRLVLVDDRPGVAEDVAHLEADRDGQTVRVVLSRSDAGWHGETVS